MLQDFLTQGVGDGRWVLGRGVRALRSTHPTRIWRWGAESRAGMGLELPEICKKPRKLGQEELATQAQRLVDSG